MKGRYCFILPGHYFCYICLDRNVGAYVYWNRNLAAYIYIETGIWVIMCSYLKQ